MGSTVSKGTWFSRWSHTLVTADIAFSVALVACMSERASLSEMMRFNIGKESVE